MKKVLITTVALAVSALTGCVTSNYEPTKYEINHSRAYNIAKAGALVTGIQDTSVPKDELERLTDTKTFRAAYVLSGYVSPQLNMTNWQGGLVNLLNWTIGPKQHGGRNSLISWMPASEAVSSEDAQAKMLSRVKISVERSLTNLDAKFALLYEENGNLVYHFYKQDWNCPTWVDGKSEISDMCAIKVRIVKPRTGIAPEFVHGVSSQIYAFTSGHDTQYNRINVINGHNSHTPQQMIYAELSRNLPAWVYLYLAPKQVSLETGDKVAFPYLLEQGKPEFFVYSQS